MGITNVGYNPFAFQSYIKTVPVNFKANKVFGLEKVDNLIDQFAVQAWQTSVNSQKLGAYDPVDIVV